MPTIKFHQDLKVYQKSFETAMEIYEISKIFPKEELYSLTDQIRRSSRSVSAIISEAWEKESTKVFRCQAYRFRRRSKRNPDLVIICQKMYLYK